MVDDEYVMRRQNAVASVKILLEEELTMRRGG